jgi:hypothetical protein
MPMLVSGPPSITEIVERLTQRIEALLQSIRKERELSDEIIRILKKQRDDAIKMLEESLAAQSKTP